MADLMAALFFAELRFDPHDPHNPDADRFVLSKGHAAPILYAAWAEAEIACGRAAAVVGALEALTAEHPYREPVWAQLMTAYYLAGRQSDALDASTLDAWRWDPNQVMANARRAADTQEEPL